MEWEDDGDTAFLLPPQQSLETKQPKKMSHRQLVIWFLSTFRIFFVSLFCFILILTVLVYQLPNRRVIMKFATHPSLWSAEGMAEIREEAFRRFHESWIFYACFICIYIFFQTFSIPGSFVLNSFAGASMGFTVGLALCCTCNTIGACCCYMLSTYSWGVIVKSYFQERIEQFNIEISKHRHNLLIYCLLLRVFPLCPCWFVNMASAFVDIPFHVFVLSVFFGLLPYNYLTVSAGSVLGHLGHADKATIHLELLKLSAIALTLSIPLLFRHRIFAAIRPETPRYVELE